jgi:hypothetical protein
MKRMNVEATEIPRTWLCSGRKFSLHDCGYGSGDALNLSEIYIYTGGLSVNGFLMLVRAAKRGIVVR